MMTAMSPSGRSELCSSLTEEQHAITAVETYGTKHSLFITDSAMKSC